MGELSRQQKDFLRRAAAGGLYGKPGAKMAKWARIAGFVECDGPAGGGMYWIDITAAGRAALETEQVAP